tara:strand:- start:141 stop:317 length:177 start_codon:yes stop_codon:yes gene_type:complete
MDKEEILELREVISDLEDRIDNFFGDDEYPHYGDRGYQELLERLEDAYGNLNELYEEE